MGLEVEHIENAFASVIDTRRIADRPVRLSPSPVRAEPSQPQDHFERSLRDNVREASIDLDSWGSLGDVNGGV